MRRNLEPLLDLLDRCEAPFLAAEDLNGESGAVRREGLPTGLIAKEPERNPTPSCPHCKEGCPFTAEGRTACDSCFSAIAPEHLLVWRLDAEALLRWIAERWRLRGTVQRIEPRLWQLGTLRSGDEARECFMRRTGRLTEAGERRLGAYRRALVLTAVPLPPEDTTGGHPCLCLLEVLNCEGALTIDDPSPLLRPRSDVRFDPATGALWAGEELLGEVPVGSREHHFLDCLARRLDSFVPYQDLAEHVLRASGTASSTEDATFCQGLKSRIKKKYIAEIDRLIATTNKGHGFRLRGYAGMRATGG
jgi:hypothetical protein